MTGQKGCPSYDELLLALTGELPADEGDAVISHVARCGTCRALLNEIDEVLLLYSVHLAEDEPATSRKEMSARFAPRLHAARQANIHRAEGPTLRRWLPMMAVAASMLIVGLCVSRNTAVLRADEILSRVAASERMRSSPRTERAELRIVPFGDGVTHVMTIGETSQVPARWASSGVGAGWSALRDQLAAAPVDWRRPLSVESVLAWRARLARRRDQVTRHDDVWLVRTSTPEGVLRVVELAVRPVTYDVVRQMLIFEQLGRVDILPAPPGPRGDVPVRTETAVRPTPDRDTLDQAELNVRLALRATDLDVDGDLRVTAVGHAIQVRGTVQSRAQRRDLVRRLAAVPHIEPEVAVVEGRAMSRLSDADSRSNALSAWRVRAASETVTVSAVPFTDALRRVALVRLRSKALTDLSSRYAAAEVQRLTPAARVLLERLLDEHYEALRLDLAAIETQLETLLGPPSGRSRRALLVPADWARRTRTVQSRADALEDAVRNVLTQPATRLGVTDYPATEHVRRDLTALLDALTR